MAASLLGAIEAKGNWIHRAPVAIPHLSRLEILEKEFGADAKHPIRRLFVGLARMLAPAVVAIAVIGVGVLAR